MTLVCLAYNLRRLHRLVAGQQRALAGSTQGPPGRNRQCRPQPARSRRPEAATFFLSSLVRTPHPGQAKLQPIPAHRTLEPSPTDS